MAKKIKVLLVDDEKEFLESLSERFELRGFEVYKAQSGPEALQVAEKTKVHAAVVDLKMPDMDGLVTITKLKEIQPKIKTILLTGFGNEKVKQATEALDSDYFEKGQMGSFWDFIKRLPQRLEDTMAAAGMASGGDIDDAKKIDKESRED
jgi:ActR/RegA family two-component response regulator